VCLGGIECGLNEEYLKEVGAFMSMDVCMSGEGGEKHDENTTRKERNYNHKQTPLSPPVYVHIVCHFPLSFVSSLSSPSSCLLFSSLKNTRS